MEMIGKTSKCVHMFFSWGRGVGPPSAVVDKLLGQVKGNGAQITSEPSARGYQSQKSLKCRVFLTVWGSHTRAVSFKRKVPRMAVKDKQNH